MKKILKNFRNAIHRFRQLHARRHWQALKVGGGGVVPLGKCTQDKAISKAAKFGSISYVDPEHAIIFYSVNI